MMTRIAKRKSADWPVKAASCNCRGLVQSCQLAASSGQTATVRLSISSCTTGLPTKRPVNSICTWPPHYLCASSPAQSRVTSVFYPQRPRTFIAMWQRLVSSPHRLCVSPRHAPPNNASGGSLRPSGRLALHILTAAAPHKMPLFVSRN